MIAKQVLTHDSYKYFPEYGGSTGGWLKAAEFEEKYVISWTSKKSEFFEMPIGGSAKCLEGLNLFYFARKEQCLALGKQLHTQLKINDYKIFRLIPGGDVEFLHPKDGVFPEKLKESRTPAGTQDFQIGNDWNELDLVENQIVSSILEDFLDCIE